MQEAGARIELRGPIGGWFTWEAKDGGPLFLVAGGSSIAPLMAMIRHRAAVGSEVPTRLLYSSRSFEEIIYREQLETLAADGAESVEAVPLLDVSGPVEFSEAGSSSTPYAEIRSVAASNNSAKDLTSKHGLNARYRDISFAPRGRYRARCPTP